LLNFLYGAIFRNIKATRVGVVSKDGRREVIAALNKREGMVGDADDIEDCNGASIRLC
jgi:hypothetical protein